jgi:predicted Zn-dependent peptidase
MQALNRTIAPDTFPIGNAKLLPVKEGTLDNKIPVYTVKGGDQEVLKIDFIFDAGLWFQSNNLVASLANSMLNEGTDKTTAAQIAEWFDFRGAYIQLSVDQNWAYVSVLTLNKHAEEIIAITEEVIKHSVFPQQQLDAILLKRKNRFIVENQKAKTICQKQFTQALFGQQHPYALTTTLEDFEKVNRDTLYQFYQNYYHADNCKIVVAGNPSDNVFALLNQHFGGNDWSKPLQASPTTPTVAPTKEKSQYIIHDDAIQTAIRMGNHIVNQTHPDYPELQVVNTILGGYFGSRLMANIREEKGYTYGIYSLMLSLTEGAYFYITTEVDKQYYNATITEIHNELKRLRTEPVSAEELAVVKNYMLGELLRDMDGPFAQSAMVKNLLEFEMDNSFIQQQINAIHNCTPKRIMELANTYFNENDLITMAVGAPQ